MKSLSQSVQRRTAVQAGGSPVAELPRHDQVDLLLRQYSKRLHLGAFELMELVQEVIDGKFHEFHGFSDAGPYLESRIGLSWRSICRQLAILESLRALPPTQIEEAKQVIAELGGHKASILAPALRKEPADWKDWVEIARESTEDALQDAVSSALGLKPRGKAVGAPGERFLRLLLNQIPPERREQTEWVFREMGRLGDATNVWSAIAVFLMLVDFGEKELGDHGVYRAEK